MRIFQVGRKNNRTWHLFKAVMIRHPSTASLLVHRFRSLSALVLINLMVCAPLTLEVAKATHNRVSKTSAITLRSTENAEAGKLDSTSQGKLIESYGKLPLSFELNQGQIKGQVRFLSRGAGYSLFMNPNEVTLSLDKYARHRNLKHSKYDPNDPASYQSITNVIEQSRDTLRIRLAGANANPQMDGLDELPGKVNYFLGSDSRKWFTDIHTYARVQYKNVYPGINQIYYGNQQHLEYDFVVAPDADPKAIKLSFDGTQALNIDAQGDLLIHTKGGVIRQHKPLIYQVINQVKYVIPGRYMLKGKSQVGFEVARYNVKEPLIIDPILSYSSYFGGSGSDVGFGIAVDNAGNAYVTGSTESNELSTLSGTNAFVAKLNADGTQRTYLAILGGSGDDAGFDIAVNSEGSVYVTGSTSSTNFPQMNAAQPIFGGGTQDAFVAKLNPSGSALVYSTYFGGSGNDAGFGIATDIVSNAYITGSTDSTELTTLTGSNAFVAKLNAAGNQRTYLAILGGNGDDVGFSVAVDSGGSAYISGSTDSTNFTTVNPLQPQIGGSQDAFVAKLNPTGSSLTYSTYFGGSGSDSGFDIAVDSNGNAYVTGSTNSPEFSTLDGTNVFVTKLSASGSERSYFAILGGSGDDAGFSIALDNAANAYVSGSSSSTNFTIANPLQSNIGGSQDAFIAKLNPTGSSLNYSTFLGGGGNDAGFGIAVDNESIAYVTGLTNSNNFIISSALQPANGGSGDAFIAKVRDTVSPTSVQFSQPAYTVDEAGGSLVIPVNRTDTTSAATVNYTTSDSSGLNACSNVTGLASSRCDYATSIGTLRFAAGEATKNIYIPIVDDSISDGNETFSIALSNPSGASLGPISSAVITITDNANTAGNPVDGASFFIRQHYIDFLGREPEPAGLAGWLNVYNNCGTTVAQPCDRIEISSAFFRSPEFQDRAYFIYRFYSAVGRVPIYSDFMPDFAKVSGFLSAQELEANKVAFVDEVMTRSDFLTRYGSLNDPTAYVNALLLTVGLPNHSSKQGWITGLTNGTMSRGQVLRALVESTEVYQKYYTEAFVIMQYFGYLRRSADISYLQWIQTMNSNGGDYRLMINGFLNSQEYRNRFGN